MIKNYPWFGERLERAKSLSAEGLSASQVALILSKEFLDQPATRNAIISLWRRLRVNHSQRKKPILSGEELRLRNQKIAELYRLGKTCREIGCQLNITRHYVYQICKRTGIYDPAREVKRKPRGPDRQPRRLRSINPEIKPNLPPHDIIAAIGVEFLDLQANHCRFPVARDPDNRQYRYCGEQRCMGGFKFSSSYCPQHHFICTKPEIISEAAE